MDFIFTPDTAAARTPVYSAYLARIYTTDAMSSLSGALTGETLALHDASPFFVVVDSFVFAFAPGVLSACAWPFAVLRYAELQETDACQGWGGTARGLLHVHDPTAWSCPCQRIEETPTCQKVGCGGCRPLPCGLLLFLSTRHVVLLVFFAYCVLVFSHSLLFTLPTLFRRGQWRSH